MKYFLSVIAMVLIIEGLPYFAFPEKMKETLKVMAELDSKILRGLGFTLITIGIIILQFSR